MSMYSVSLKVKNGGSTHVFSTHDRQHAACYCQSKNDYYRKVNSPNRYYFEETADE